MKKLLLIILLIIILVAGVIFITEDESNVTSVTLVLDYTPNTNHTGFYVALDQGFYENYGLDVEIVQPSQTSTETLVDSGAVQFGISYQENVTLARDNGLEIQSIMALNTVNTSGFIAHADSGIEEPSDLNGKTYCGWGTEIEAILVNEFISLATDDNIEIEYYVTSFSNVEVESECDFYWEFEGWGNIYYDLNGVDYVYFPLIDYGIDFYTPVLITSDSMIEENYDIVESFVHASIEGFLYTINYPEEAADILLKYVPELDYDLVHESQLFLTPILKYDDQQFGYQYDYIWEDFTNMLKKYEIIDEDLDHSILYTNEFVESYEN